MSALKIVYFSATAGEIPSLSRAVTRYLAQGGLVSVTARTRSQLFDNARIEAFVQEALKAHMVLITLHGGKNSCPALASLLEAMQERRAQGLTRPYLHIQPMGGDEEAVLLAHEHADGLENGVWNTINNYILFGGVENFLHLLHFIHDVINGTESSVLPPRKIPSEGIYHPDFPYIPSLEEYVSRKIDPRKPTLGIWFYQTYWVNGDLTYIDALIREAEHQGANVLALFHVRYPNKTLKNMSVHDLVARYFMDGRRSRIDVLLNPMMFSLVMAQKDYRDILPRLNVPFLQAITMYTPYARWHESPQGLSTMEVSYSAAQPEFDGALINVPIASREENEHDPVTGALLAKLVPIPDRVKRLISLALNWARLRRTPNREKKVAIIFHQYPPRNDRIGVAAGLDSFASVKHLLDRLVERGYQVEKTYESGQAMAEELLARMTYDRRWQGPDQLAERAQIHADPEHYQAWHAALPKKVSQKMTADWGPVPGDLFVHNGRLHFAGTINGNFFITMQPPRGFYENTSAIIHDPHLSPPHLYLMKYRWIKEVFKAHAVIHVGKHGSLEWLPGKALGLSQECYPDLAIMDLPNIYPYIINDPSEGTQAKRRSYCGIVDHLPPAFTNADLYEDLAKLDNLLRDYAEAEREDPSKLEILRSQILEAVKEADLDKDLNIELAKAQADFPAFLQHLHAYLAEVADTMITDGLHTLGLAPQGEQLVEFLVQLTRLPNGHVPSLREAVAAVLGFHYDELATHKGQCLSHFGGRTGGQIIRQIHELCVELVRRMAAADFHADPRDVAMAVLGRSHNQLEAVLEYIAKDLVPRIRETTAEIESIVKALEGGFLRPGPSGAPTRGQAEILPTGRNFYSVDPQKIPSPAAWETGKRLGDALIQRCLRETGAYPESVGIILWGGSTMRTKGDDLAEILYLMGVRPVWHKGSGNVEGVEVIPLEELRRPRIDVVVRISGFFRDCFPNLIELMDQAVHMVASLKENPDSNFILRHVWRDVEQYEQEGKSHNEAWRESTFRVFGCPPGTYGAGVAELIESKTWNTRQDLAENYIRYSAHAYGTGSYGAAKASIFKRLLSRMDVTVKNEDSREYDLLSCTDYYNYYGGLIVAATNIRGSAPLALVGDSSDPKRVIVRTTFEEAKHIFRSRILNPKWIEGLKRHGYKGAGDLSKVMDILLGWDATAELIDDYMYERFAAKYALDPEMQRWLKEVNPYALQNILDKLLEAVERGLWHAPPELVEQLQEAYLETEALIEETTAEP
ncbi:MAG: cobaltochelatase subunit CobN [Desulfosoma sp.]|uniref:cobaltochelatase subunit CobN n=1 Tax=Desulfosoma sp. TaxID=2603217 RepID=UPI00404B40C2